jgi:hypothetical protein
MVLRWPLGRCGDRRHRRSPRSTRLRTPRLGPVAVDRVLNRVRAGSIRETARRRGLRPRPSLPVRDSTGAVARVDCRTTWDDSIEPENVAEPLTRHPDPAADRDLTRPGATGVGSGGTGTPRSRSIATVPSIVLTTQTALVDRTARGPFPTLNAAPAPIRRLQLREGASDCPSPTGIRPGRRRPVSTHPDLSRRRARPARSETRRRRGDPDVPTVGRDSVRRPLEWELCLDARSPGIDDADLVRIHALEVVRSRRAADCDRGDDARENQSDDGNKWTPKA